MTKSMYTNSIDVKLIEKITEFSRKIFLFRDIEQQLNLKKYM